MIVEKRKNEEREREREREREMIFAITLSWTAKESKILVTAN